MASNVIVNSRAPDLAATAREPLRTRFYDRFEALPAGYRVLFERSARRDFCLTTSSRPHRASSGMHATV